MADPCTFRPGSIKSSGLLPTSLHARPAGPETYICPVSLFPYLVPAPCPGTTAGSAKIDSRYRNLFDIPPRNCLQ
jgi:hypothetical protein